MPAHRKDSMTWRDISNTIGLFHGTTFTCQPTGQLFFVSNYGNMLSYHETNAYGAK